MSGILDGEGCPRMPSQERLLSANEAARQLNVSKKTLYKYCREHRLNYVKLPGERPTFKFHQAGLDLFIAQHTVKAG